jgi:hypothetical protein
MTSEERGKRPPLKLARDLPPPLTFPPPQEPPVALENPTQAIPR